MHDQQRDEPPRPTTCPWCGQHKLVYIRAGSDLVCVDCSKQAQALEATADDA